MRTIERGAEFVVEDSPGLHWILGLLFLGVGTILVLGPLGLFVNAESITWFQRGASLSMGGCGVVAGLWVLRGAPRSRLLLLRATGRVRITRTGVGGRIVYEWPVSEIAGVQVLERKDDEDSDIFQIHLLLGAGRSEPVSQLWTHGREAALGCAGRISEALNVPLTGVTPLGVGARRAAIGCSGR
jgi:hypothetical protein